MATKILTVVPLLVLSGLFFAAGIIEGGVLFLVSATVICIAFLRMGSAELPSPEEPSAIAARSSERPPERGDQAI